MDHIQRWQSSEAFVPGLPPARLLFIPRLCTKTSMPSCISGIWYCVPTELVDCQLMRLSPEKEDFCMVITGWHNSDSAQVILTDSHSSGIQDHHCYIPFSQRETLTRVRYEKTIVWSLRLSPRRICSVVKKMRSETHPPRALGPRTLEPSYCWTKYRSCRDGSTLDPGAINN